MIDLSKVCVDATPLDTNHKFRGFGRYVTGLFSGFSELNPEPKISALKTNNFIFQERIIKPPRYYALPSRLHWVFNKFFLARHLSNNGIKLFHATDPGNILNTKRIKVIATAHDLIPWLFESEYINGSPFDRKAFYKNIINTYKKADHIIAISEATKSDFVKYIGIDEKKISVVYLGYDSKIFLKRDLKFNLQNTYSKNFFLYAGGFDPRKNIKLLLKSFSMVKNQVQEKLILAGKMTDQEKKQVITWNKELGISQDVTITGYISDLQLVELYNQATAFVFPSKYEGFGLPLLEAMACHCPVITSNVSSMPEITQGAALLINPEDEYSLSKALIKITHDNILRDTLIEKGKFQISRFSWRECANKTLNIYKSFG